MSKPIQNNTVKSFDTNNLKDNLCIDKPKDSCCNFENKDVPSSKEDSKQKQKQFYDVNVEPETFYLSMINGGLNFHFDPQLDFIRKVGQPEPNCFDSHKSSNKMYSIEKKESVNKPLAPVFCKKVNKTYDNVESGRNKNTSNEIVSEMLKSQKKTSNNNLKANPKLKLNFSFSSNKVNRTLDENLQHKIGGKIHSDRNMKQNKLESSSMRFSSDEKDVSSRGEEKYPQGSTLDGSSGFSDIDNHLNLGEIKSHDPLRKLFMKLQKYDKLKILQQAIHEDTCESCSSNTSTTQPDVSLDTSNSLNQDVEESPHFFKISCPISYCEENIQDTNILKHFQRYHSEIPITFMKPDEIKGVFFYPDSLKIGINTCLCVFLISNKNQNSTNTFFDKYSPTFLLLRRCKLKDLINSQEKQFSPITKYKELLVIWIVGLDTSVHYTIKIQTDGIHIYPVHNCSVSGNVCSIHDDQDLEKLHKNGQLIVFTKNQCDLITDNGKKMIEIQIHFN